MIVLDALLVFLSWWLGGPNRSAQRAKGVEPQLGWHVNGLLILAGGFLVRDVWMLFASL